jgi:hypothetical protein
MKRLEWNDKQLEEILRQMPKIKDHRHPQDIYQNLSFKLRRKKLHSWILPTTAMAATLLLFAILVPNIMDLSSSSNEKAVKHQASTAENQKAAKIEGNQKESVLMMQKDQESQSISLKQEEISKTAVYKSDIGNGKVLTYWIPDKYGQMLIPVSTIINHPGKKSWIELFNENMAHLKETEWGLAEFYPLKATLKLNSKANSLVIDVPKNHPYGQGSANETTFLEAMQRNVSTNSNIRTIELTTNGAKGITFGNLGERTTLDVPYEQKRAYLLYIPNEKELPFLVPSMDTYKNIKDALKAMQIDQPDRGLKAPLSTNLPLKFHAVKNRTLILSVQQNTKVEDLANTVYSYEAILFTAKEFGLDHVMLENPKLKNLGPYDLTKINNVPIAPNLRTIQDQP